MTRLYAAHHSPGTAVELYITALVCLISAGMVWTAGQKPRLWACLGSDPRPRLLKIAAVVLLGACSLNYLAAQIARLRSPFLGSDFGSTLFTHAWRYAVGLPIYCNPEECPVVGGYNPLYMVLTGLLLRVTGPALWVPKAISAVSIIGTALLIFWHLIATERSRMAAWLGGLAWLAAFEVTGRWYDLPRVDPLLTFCWMAGFVLMHRGRASRLLGVTFLVLAYWTKQNALAAVAGGFACMWVLGTRRATHWLLAAILVALEITVPWMFLNWSTSGWFKFWTLDIVVASDGLYHGFSPLRASFFFWVRQAPLWLLVASLVRPRTPPDRLFIRSWWLMTACALIMGLSGIWHVGGWVNSLIPLEAFLCLGVGHAFAGTARIQPSRFALWQSSGILLLIVLLGVAWFPCRLDHLMPVAAVLKPYRQDSTVDRLVESIASYPRDVWVPESPEFALLAGKAAFDTAAYLNDYRRDRFPLPNRLYRLISSQTFDAVFLSEGRRPVQTRQGPMFGGFNREAYHFSAFPPDFVRLFIEKYKLKDQPISGWDVYIPRRDTRSE